MISNSKRKEKHEINGYERYFSFGVKYDINLI